MTHRTIIELAQEMRANSERWFPEMHAATPDLSVFDALGLAGEVGEVANLVKKVMRGDDVSTLEGIGAELADCFTYLLLLADEMGVDIEAEYEAKAAKNEARWGR